MHKSDFVTTEPEHAYWKKRADSYILHNCLITSTIKLAQSYLAQIWEDASIWQYDPVQAHKAKRRGKRKIE